MMKSINKSSFSSDSESLLSRTKAGGLFGSMRNRADNTKNSNPKKSHRSTNTSFLMKIEKQQWTHIRKRLQSKKGHKLVKATGCYGITILALALGHNAPLDIIETIIKLDSTQALSKDVLGASPLHIACLNGAHIESIELLVKKYPHLVSDRDADLRTPLHHAVEFICRLERPVDFDRGAIFEVIQLLIDIAPEVIHWTDKDGDSPLDLTHVVMMETDSSSFTEDESIFSRVESLHRVLKQFSIKVYLNKKKKWEEEGFDTLAKVKETPYRCGKSLSSDAMFTAPTVESESLD